MPSARPRVRGPGRSRRRLRLACGLTTAIALLAAGCTSSHQLRSSPPADGPRWVVTLGDSYVSGEGARWAGTTLGDATSVDALGPDAYFDRQGTESAPGCHRAESSIATIDLPGMRGRNLACSGARTASDPSGVRFKPGLDFAEDERGVGQALALQRFASGHAVSTVAVSIGGNDFGFGRLVRSCLSPVVVDPATDPQCRRDSDVTQLFTAEHREAVRADIAAALRRVAGAMARAGYGIRDFRLVVLTYPSPVPPGQRMRRATSPSDRAGCLVSRADATWLNRTALTAINRTVSSAAQTSGLPNVTVLDLATLFAGHRLCERGTSSIEGTRLTSWRSPGAARWLEWVNPLYLSLTPWELQESLHPNYWGTAAQRACLRAVLTSPETDAARCVAVGSTAADGTPVVRLVAQ